MRDFAGTGDSGRTPALFGALLTVAMLTLTTATRPEGLAAQIPEGMEGLPFVPHPEGDAAIDRLYSPFCPGQMLETCPSPNAKALRDSIHGMAYEGAERDEIVEWVLTNHGRQYLALPPGSGLGLWAWILPPFVLVGGAFAVALYLRRAAPAPGATGVGPSGSARKDVSGRATSSATSRDRPVTDDEAARLRSAIEEIELSEDPTF